MANELLDDVQAAIAHLNISLKTGSWIGVRAAHEILSHGQPEVDASQNEPSTGSYD